MYISENGPEKGTSEPDLKNSGMVKKEEEANGLAGNWPVGTEDLKKKKKSICK